MSSLTSLTIIVKNDSHIGNYLGLNYLLVIFLFYTEKSHSKYDLSK